MKVEPSSSPSKSNMCNYWHRHEVDPAADDDDDVGDDDYTPGATAKSTTTQPSLGFVDCWIQPRRNWTPVIRKTNSWAFSYCQLIFHALPFGLDGRKQPEVREGVQIDSGMSVLLRCRDGIRAFVLLG